MVKNRLLRRFFNVVYSLFFEGSLVFFKQCAINRRPNEIFLWYLSVGRHCLCQRIQAVVCLGKVVFLSGFGCYHSAPQLPRCRCFSDPERCGYCRPKVAVNPVDCSLCTISGWVPAQGYAAYMKGMPPNMHDFTPNVLKQRAEEAGVSLESFRFSFLGLIPSLAFCASRYGYEHFSVEVFA